MREDLRIGEQMISVNRVMLPRSFADESQRPEELSSATIEESDLIPVGLAFLDKPFVFMYLCAYRLGSRGRTSTMSAKLAVLSAFDALGAYQASHLWFSSCTFSLNTTQP